MALICEPLEAAGKTLSGSIIGTAIGIAMAIAIPIPITNVKEGVGGYVSSFLAIAAPGCFV